MLESLFHSHEVREVVALQVFLQLLCALKLRTAVLAIVIPDGGAGRGGFLRQRHPAPATRDRRGRLAADQHVVQNK